MMVTAGNSLYASMEVPSQNLPPNKNNKKSSRDLPVIYKLDTTEFKKEITDPLWNKQIDEMYPPFFVNNNNQSTPGFVKMNQPIPCAEPQRMSNQLIKHGKQLFLSVSLYNLKKM